MLSPTLGRARRFVSPLRHEYIGVGEPMGRDDILPAYQAASAPRPSQLMRRAPGTANWSLPEDVAAWHGFEKGTFWLGRSPTEDEIRTALTNYAFPRTV